MNETCDEYTILWPDVEALEVRCERPAGHLGLHRDEFVWWDGEGDSGWLP